MQLKIMLNATSTEETDENGNPTVGGILTSEVVSDDLNFSAAALCREMEKDEVLKEIVFHASAEFTRLHS
jgi:hypothetical protein